MTLSGAMHNRYVRIAVALLLIQVFDTTLLLPARDIPRATFLQRMPHRVGDWSMTGQAGLEADVASALSSDDYLARYYARPDGQNAEIVVAYFASHIDSFGPHSPDVCLPAAGWTITQRSKQTIAVGTADVPVNYYVIRKDGRYSAVLYWYQLARHTQASEIGARVRLAIDTLLLNRSDIALVRVTVPMDGPGDARAPEAVTELAAATHDHLQRIWP